MSRPEDTSDFDPRLTEPAADASRPGTNPSAPQYAVELPYPEELQAWLDNRYVVEGFLGQGGMGAVYKGLQMPLKRPVAIKILAKGAGADYAFEERFKREAYAMASLTHPHIVQVYDCGDAGTDFLFISMELVQGGDLSEALKNKQVTQELALKLMPQICDGLQAAHERGIIHRDIKPANIFLTADGRAKVADFGLAKKLDTQGTMVTKTGLGLGTPDYAAPEQYENLPDIDHRADIYSLGVMMYQLLTGSVPRGSWRAPSARGGSDPRLDSVVLKALESDRDERYQTVAEMKADILRVTAQPLNTGKIPTAIPVGGAINSATPAVRTGGIPTKTSAVPIAPRNTGPVSPRQTASVPVKPQPATVTRAVGTPRPTFSAPAKSGPSMGLIVGVLCAVAAIAVGAWTLLGKGGGSGKVVDVLNLADLQGTPLRGIWMATPTGLNGKTPGYLPGVKDDDRMPVYELNYSPPEEYDFEIEFTRVGGSVVQILSAAGVTFAHEFTTGSDNGTPVRAGINHVGPKPLHSATEGFVMMPPPTRNGTRHVAAVQVRRGSIRSSLDGKEVVRWSGDLSRLSMPNGFRLSSTGEHLGLASWGGDVIFHRATVREVSGPGEFTSGSTSNAGGTSLSLEEIKGVMDWVVSVKGYVLLRTGGITRKVTKVEDFPAKCDGLIEVEVGGARPQAPIPAGVLASLSRAKEMKKIALRSAMLTPDDVTSLLKDKPFLTNLNLGSNKLDDRIFASVLHLQTLEGFDVSYMKTITGAGIEKLAALPRLTSVVLNDTSISDATLPSLARLTGLKGINLANINAITDAGVAALSGLAQLESLNLKGTSVTVRGLRALGSATKLRRLDLGLGKGIKDIGDFAELRGVLPAWKEVSLDLNGPTEKEMIPQLARIAELAAIPTLTRLEFRGSGNLRASMIAGVDKLPLLDYLDIFYPFTDEDAVMLKGAKTLRTLRLANADFTEIGALNLAGVVSLRDVNRTAFTDAGLKTFREYRSDVKVSD